MGVRGRSKKLPGAPESRPTWRSSFLTLKRGGLFYSAVELYEFSSLVQVLITRTSPPSFGFPFKLFYLTTPGDREVNYALQKEGARLVPLRGVGFCGGAPPFLSSLRTGKYEAAGLRWKAFPSPVS